MLCVVVVMAMLCGLSTVCGSEIKGLGFYPPFKTFNARGMMCPQGQTLCKITNRSMLSALSVDLCALHALVVWFRWFESFERKRYRCVLFSIFHRSFHPITRASHLVE